MNIKLLFFSVLTCVEESLFSWILHKHCFNTGEKDSTLGLSLSSFNTVGPNDGNNLERKIKKISFVVTKLNYLPSTQFMHISRSNKSYDNLARNTKCKLLHQLVCQFRNDWIFTLHLHSYPTLLFIVKSLMQSMTISTIK